MKKAMMVLIVFLAVFILEAKEAQAFRVTITVVIGNGSSCTGRGICSVTIEVALRAAPGGTTQVLDGNAELKGDKLLVTLSKSLNEMATNEKGQTKVSITRPQQLSQEVAKQLGFSSASILPGEYSLSNNSFAFDIKGVSVSGPVRGNATGTK